MKKYAAYLLSVMTAGFLLTGCGDKTTDEVVFTNLTVEQNKTKIQDEGLAMMEKLNGMTDLTGIFALQDLEVLLYNSELTGDPIGVAVNRLIAPMAHLDKNVLGVTQLRSTAMTIDSISGVMAEIGGVYTYNSSTGAFNRVANATKIEVLFPIGFSTTNNGKLTIDNLTVKASTTQQAELPKSLDIKLTKATSTLMSFSYTAAYDAHDVPTSWSTSLTFLEGYKFTQSLTNTTTDVSWQFAYAYNNENLLSGKFSSKGDFSYDAMNNSDGLTDQEMIDQVLENANAWVQLGNLKVTGLVDVNKMMTAYDAAFPSGETDSEADVTKLCQLLNSHVSLVLLYAKENTAIAKSNFYVNEYMTYDWVLNTNTHYYEMKEVKAYEPSMQFQFKDGSAMDDSFFAEGFENLIGAFQDMLTDMQTNYAQ